MGLTRGAGPRLAVPVPSRHDAVLPWVTALRRINRQASVVICFLNEKRFEVLSCHFRPDRRGRIRCITHRPWLLRSSQCCSPRTRLAVRSARSRGRAGLAAFPCSTTFTMDDLGPLSTPAVRHSRRAIKESPNLTAYPFGRSLKQSLVASQP
jgi:hypothetical protein